MYCRNVSSIHASQAQEHVIYFDQNLYNLVDVNDTTYCRYLSYIILVYLKNRFFKIEQLYS